MRPEIPLLLLVLIETAGCRGDTVPAQQVQLREPYKLSQDQPAGISVSLTVASTAVAPGDTVRFIASAYNSTSQSIQIGRQCGPAMDVIVTGPDGGQVSVLFARHVGFTCELGPRHFADPGETETVHLEWQAPQQRGEYIAMAGLRRADGLSNLSAPVRLTVR